MKKFFSLVLALVMALSLTTAAWGAEVTTISTPEDLIAFAESVNVEHLTYTGKTVTLANDIDMTGKTLTAIGSLLNGYCFGGTFDGNGKTISNLTVTSLDACGTGLFGSVDEHHGHMVIKDLTIDGATITATAGGPVGAILGMGYAATIENCQVKNSVVKSGGAYDQHSGAAAIVGNGLGVSVVEDCSATNCIVDTTANGNPAGEIAGPWSPAGAVVDSTSSGNKIVASLGTTDATYDNLYLKGTDKGDVITAYTVDLGYVEAEAAVYNTDGSLKTEGNVAYFVTDDTAFAGKYLAVNTLAEADVIVYKDAAGTNVYMYLDEVEMVKFVGDGTPYADFGANCGQIAKTSPYYNKTATYYTWGGILYRVAKATETGDRGVMVGGKVVEVVTCDTVANLMTKHAPLCTYKEGVITAIECKECGMDAVKAANFMSIPKNAQNVYDNVAQTYWYFPSSVAAGAVVDTETKVESAETFDAGIAMYVGMSVMAAAGSMVVLKKRED